jgi:single-stranded-DNA-specific exonuclease
MKWEILHKPKVHGVQNIVEILLKNRGIKTEKQRKEFFEPVDPMKIPLKSLGISEIQVGKATNRIKKAIKNKEHIIVYGDYDADGITGTATMWEVLNEAGAFVLPHIPERFSEGYGLNLESVKSLKDKDPKLSLIITVDHGITVGKKVDALKEMGVDMIISDHHQVGKTKPKPLALIYTTDIGGSALAWFFAREISKKIKLQSEKFRIEERLELAAIGTIADQIPLKGANRSIVKFGLVELNNTKRPGLKALIEEAGIKDDVGTYEVGFIIAPRINSMGRLKHGIESLRLLCTRIPIKARELAMNIGRTNFERQRIVEEVVIHARNSYKDIEKQSVIVLAHESYHEGVIGLAAAKLVEEFYRPAIVLSKSGDISKASARSIPGFNIIEAIRKLEKLYIEGGGHPMAAGFSIHTEKIEEFSKEINKLAKSLLTQEILSKKLNIDLEVSYEDLTPELFNELAKFEPIGLGNPGPSFVSKNVEILDIRAVGRDAKHLKLKLKQDEHIMDTIYFGGGEIYPDLNPGTKADVVYRLEENVWNGRVSLQLVIRDLRIYN